MKNTGFWQCILMDGSFSYIIGLICLYVHRILACQQLAGFACKVFQKKVQTSMSFQTNKACTESIDVSVRKRKLAIEASYPCLVQRNCTFYNKWKAIQQILYLQLIYSFQNIGNWEFYNWFIRADTQRLNQMLECHSFSLNEIQ